MVPWNVGGKGYLRNNPALAARSKRLFAQKNSISILADDRDIFDACRHAGCAQTNEVH